MFLSCRKGRSRHRLFSFVLPKVRSDTGSFLLSCQKGRTRHRLFSFVVPKVRTDTSSFLLSCQKGRSRHRLFSFSCERYELTPVLSFCLAKRKEPFSDFQRKEKRLDGVLRHFRKPVRRSGSIPTSSDSAAAALCEFEALFPVRSAPLGDEC